MFEVLLSLLWSFRVYFRSQADLQAEILALRHQIVVLQRRTPKPKLKPADRRFWVGLSQFLAAMAFGTLDRETGHRYRLAPSRVPLVLDLENSARTARSATGFERKTR